MTRTDLNFYLNPASIGINISILTTEQAWYRSNLFVDTAAEYSLLPISLLDLFAYRFVETIEMEQAGIARQYFKGILAAITVKITDAQGQSSRPLEVEVVFAQTKARLLGFGGFLNEAILYMNMPRLTGYLEIE